MEPSLGSFLFLSLHSFSNAVLISILEAFLCLTIHCLSYNSFWKRYEYDYKSKNIWWIIGERIRKVTKKSGNRGRCRKLSLFSFISFPILFLWLSFQTSFSYILSKVKQRPAGYTGDYTVNVSFIICIVLEHKDIFLLQLLIPLPFLW